MTTPQQRAVFVAAKPDNSVYTRMLAILQRNTATWIDTPSLAQRLGASKSAVNVNGEKMVEEKLCELRTVPGHRGTTREWRALAKPVPVKAADGGEGACDRE